MSTRLRCATAKAASRPGLGPIQEALTQRIVKKYAPHFPDAATVVPSHVGVFLRLHPSVTEDSLRALDREVVAALNRRRMHPKRAGEDGDDIQSAKLVRPATVKSGSRPPGATVAKQTASGDEFATVARKTGAGSDQDWERMVQFNSELYKEELTQAQTKKRKQQLALKFALDQQRAQQQLLASGAQDELEAYRRLERQQCSAWKQQERERQSASRRQKAAEKQRIQKQLQDERSKKRAEALSRMQYECMLVAQNRRETRRETEAQQERKELIRNTHGKMLRENEASKRQQAELQFQTKEQEKRELAEYVRMLEQEERERIGTIQERERRTRELLDRVGGGVVKELNKRRRLEEQKFFRYQREKEIKDQAEEEKRLIEAKQRLWDMRMCLDKQVQEKRMKSAAEQRASFCEADSRKKELRLYAREENDIKRKVHGMNHEYADYLRQQMTGGRTCATAMSQAELVRQPGISSHRHVRTDVTKC